MAEYKDPRRGKGANSDSVSASDMLNPDVFVQIGSRRSAEHHPAPSQKPNTEGMTIVMTTHKRDMRHWRRVSLRFAMAGASAMSRTRRTMRRQNSRGLRRPAGERRPHDPVGVFAHCAKCAARE